MRQRGLGVLARELQETERRLRREECGRGLQRKAEFTLGGLQVPALEKRPAALRAQRRRTRRERRRNRRLPELREFVVGDDGRRDDLRRARAGAHDRRQEEPAHLTDSTAGVRVRSSGFRVQGSRSGSGSGVLAFWFSFGFSFSNENLNKNRNLNQNPNENIERVREP